MSNERLVEIESKLAHVEMLVEELNAVVTKQQATIDQLEKAIRIMANKSVDGSQKQSPLNTKPPHY